MANIQNLTMRQMLEGMTLVFDPDAAGDLAATIQFNVNGEEPGCYHLRIGDGDCTFHRGAAEAPSLTITTPSEVWLQISRGELSGQEALMQGLYQANGDLSLMLRMDALFSKGTDSRDGYAAPTTQRPPGPLPLAGMAWMTVAFIPWTAFWVLFDIPSVSAWLSVGGPLALSAALVGYRLAFNRPTWMEWGELGFFTFAGLMTLVGSATFATWGSVISQLVMGALWLSSLLFNDMPLCAEYSKWEVVQKLWRTTLFIHPNAAISLMWGWQSILSALVGVAAVLLPQWYTWLTVLRYLLLVPAFIFTTHYQKDVESRRIRDIDGALTSMQRWAAAGLAAVGGIVVMVAIL